MKTSTQKEVRHSQVLSRIDRSVADNLKDISVSFEQDAGIVKDFIVFISKRIKMDLFGFTTFTLKQFCEETGRHIQDMHALHPHFKNNPKLPRPEYNGHKFESYFDYALLNMLRHNIIFSTMYTYNSHQETIHLEKFSILKDIKLNNDRREKSKKVYEIRLSNELIEGFAKRYYTIDLKGYSKVGKGRGGDGRKSLYLLLERTAHILLSKNIKTTKLSVDYIAGIAGINVLEPKNRKTSVKRVLDVMIKKGGIPFEYEFVQGNPNRPHQEEYHVEITYHGVKAESRGETTFFMRLIEELEAIFSTYHKNTRIAGEVDLFQRWLNNNQADLKFKIEALRKAYNIASSHKQELSEKEAKNIILSGTLWQLFLSPEEEQEAEIIQ